MHLRRIGIPRAWLPEAADSERMQLVITMDALEEVTAVLTGFSASRARFVCRMIGAFDVCETPREEDGNFVGRFESDKVQVSAFHETHMYIDGELGELPVARGTHIVVSLWQYEQGLHTDDPQNIFYVVLYWDEHARLWRMHNERWQLEEGSTTDPDAPTVVSAIFVELEAGDDPELRHHAPDLLDLLAALNEH